MEHDAPHGSASGSPSESPEVSAGTQAPVHLADGATFKLYIGCETIEVRVDARGIRFQHSQGSDTEGFLPWDTAIALSLLPDELKRAARVSAA